MNKFLIIQLVTNLLATVCLSQHNKEILYPEKQAAKIKSESSPITSSVLPVINFRYAARKATPAVVHIKSYYAVKTDRFQEFWDNNFWYRFFPPDKNTALTQVATASGVIVSTDGYIVTNNHVVDKAQKIEVILPNKKNCLATMVGADAATDLALLKIGQNNLPVIEFGHSDSVEVGDVVLAVGNPFNLASTVTAGIVSAKARDIKLLANNEAVDSYIQTDAAMNPGNSGGALVDVNGRLIGINCAIATTTGAYAGYSFAIPVDVVKKTIDDLQKFGKVMRGYLGAIISEMNWEKAKMLGISTASGVLIDSLRQGCAAMKAGLQKNDVIVKIDNHVIETVSQLKEAVAMYEPGEYVYLTVNRHGEEKIFRVVLSDANDMVDNVSKEMSLLSSLGVTIENTSADEKRRLGISGGVKIVSVTDGIISHATNIQEGFVVVAINKKRIRNTEHFIHVIQNSNRSLLIAGIYPNHPGIYYYSLEIK